MNRRSFLKKLLIGSIVIATGPTGWMKIANAKLSSTTTTAITAVPGYGLITTTTLPPEHWYYQN